MNNSKVRIYDLSKELHLENKEIIEICEYLNIPVKSHSSTITEDEAERIKATAEKPEKWAGQKAARARKTGRKDQILAIHHRQNRPESAPTLKKPTTSPQNSSTSLPKPVLASPPTLQSPSPKTSPPESDLSYESESSDSIDSYHCTVRIHLCFGDRLASAYDFKRKPTFNEDTALGSAHRYTDDHSFHKPVFFGCI